MHGVGYSKLLFKAPGDNHAPVRGRSSIHKTPGFGENVYNVGGVKVWL